VGLVTADPGLHAHLIHRKNPVTTSCNPQASSLSCITTLQRTQYIGLSVEFDDVAARSGAICADCGYTAGNGTKTTMTLGHPGQNRGIRTPPAKTLDGCPIQHTPNHAPATPDGLPRRLHRACIARRVHSRSNRRQADICRTGTAAGSQRQGTRSMNGEDSE
jgi:hypothetical protein